MFRCSHSGARVLTGGLALAFMGTVLAWVSAASADYLSISHALFEASPNTTYDPVTGLFTIEATNEGLLALNDSPPLSGVVSDISLHLETTLDHQGEASGLLYFHGGSFALTFVFDPDGAAPPAAHEISGPIYYLLALWTLTTPQSSRLDLIGSWTADTVNLPGSNVWPDGGMRSTLDSFSIIFPIDADDWNWETDPLSGSVQAQYGIFPYDGPITPPPLNDWNNDCVVDLRDYQAMMICMNQDDATASTALACIATFDANDDARIDVADLAVFVQNIGGPLVDRCTQLSVAARSAGTTTSRPPAGGGADAPVPARPVASKLPPVDTLRLRP